MATKGALNLGCEKQDYETFSYLIESFFFEDFNPLLYADLLPYWELEEELRPCRLNPLGIPGVEFLGAPYSNEDMNLVERVIFDHCVYKEFSSEGFAELGEDIDDYLLRWGVRADDTLFNCQRLRVFGFISGVYATYFSDQALPIKSEVKKIEIPGKYENEFFYPGKTLSKNSIKAAIKKAKELRRVLDSRLLMHDSQSFLKLDSLLQSLISLNSRVIDPDDELEHYLFSGNTNHPNHAIRMTAFRLTLFFYQMHRSIERDFVESIMSHMLIEMDKATTNRHLDDAKTYALALNSRSRW